jgi:hypothetical protein
MEHAHPVFNRKISPIGMNRLKEIQGKLNTNFFKTLLAGNEILKSIYTKELNNAKRSNLYKTNSNYRALHGVVNAKLMNVIKTENRPSIRYRMQQGGTCWFHSIVNALLMSQRPRAILKRMSENVPDDNRRRNFNLCPMRSAPSLLFWRYIKHRLEGFGGVSSAFKNTNVIKSSGVRGFDHRVRIFLREGLRRAMARDNFEGGTKHDLFNFYRKMFPRGLFIIKEYKGEAPIPHTLAGGYTLTHADITAWIRPLALKANTIIYGHTIAGYITPTGKYKMYDSASDKVINYDWTRPTQTYWADHIIMTKTFAVFTRDT